MGLIISNKVLASSVDSLQVNFHNDAQIEVGSFFAGVEFHHSSYLPQRISFYYPAANSIDISSDYWMRDTTHILKLGLKIGKSNINWLGINKTKFSLTPYSVAFNEKENGWNINISYRFCMNKPAMVVSYEITNTSSLPDTFQFFTNWETSLRTSHTYAIKRNAEENYTDELSTMFINYNDIETKNAQVFIINAADKPNTISYLDSLNIINAKDDFRYNTPGNKNILPSAVFYYKKYIQPNGKLSIIQIIGTCKIGEGKQIVQYLKDNYMSEIKEYENYICSYEKKSIFDTGDNVIDNSFLWAKAILAANRHYIDGDIVPMPCPAEYNFFFTHDVLLSDLAAVNFDIDRVKEDLSFIIKHADTDYIIPHAYYWKDTLYKTEYATPDNWNHLWFLILSGSYLRHSNDTIFLRKLYPYIKKSITEVLKNKQGGLIYAYRPDWWDIGRNFGPRSYMNILVIKAIRDFNFISLVLNKNISEIKLYEKIADDLQLELNKKLWNGKFNYLMNYYEDGSLDKHYYMGSILACHFNTIDDEKKKKLINTTENKLFDKRLGIYTVFPMDFQNLINYLKFNGNEAGDPFKYINGGIWPHANAWYTLGLISINEKEKAYNFLKNIMSLSGVINSPNGQPAMYEYRNSNYNKPQEYGKIDKPQFMWAAAWYIYVMYHLWGIEENDFNISFNPLNIHDQRSYEFDLILNGNLTKVKVKGSGKYLKTVYYDKEQYPSAVIPAFINKVKQIDLSFGTPKIPYLLNTNSVLENCNYVNLTKSLNIQLRGFPGQRNKSVILSPLKPKQININSIKSTYWKIKQIDKLYMITLDFNQTGIVDKITVIFSR